MAVKPKLIKDIRSNTAAAATFQPASGKLWWFKALRFAFDMDGTAGRELQVQRSDGTSHREEVRLHHGSSQNLNAVDVDSNGTPTNPPRGEVPFDGPDTNTHRGADSAGLWFDNGWYIRVKCNVADSGTWWQLAWFGIEADV
jgi:hypothetical protein